MANHRNRVNLICTGCNVAFEIIKSRLTKAERHFCNAKCRSIFCGKERRLNKYPKVIGACKLCKKDIIAKYMAMDKSTRRFCSYSCNTTYKNITDNPVNNPGAREKISIGQKNREKDSWNWTKERRITWAISLQGEKSHFWKGGLTDENRGHRNSVYYTIWREEVFKRDNWTCQTCGSRSGQGKAVVLNADHIKSWSLYPELRFELNNGRTLCLDCHKQTPNFGFKAIFNQI